MYSAVFSAAFFSLGYVAAAAHKMTSYRANFYRGLPEYPLDSIPELLENPSQELIDASPTVYDRETGQEIIQVPQQIPCTVTGVSACLYHQIIPSVASIQRRKNAEARQKQLALKDRYIPGHAEEREENKLADISPNDIQGLLQFDQKEEQRELAEKRALLNHTLQTDPNSPHYMTSYEDEGHQIQKTDYDHVITDPLCLSNIVDTQLFDTLLERQPEKLDKNGNVIQSALYSLRREEKPHDNQTMGTFLRLVDPWERQFFHPKTHQYLGPSGRYRHNINEQTLKSKRLAWENYQKDLLREKHGPDADIDQLYEEHIRSIGLSDDSFQNDDNDDTDDNDDNDDGKVRIPKQYEHVSEDIHRRYRKTPISPIELMTMDPKDALKYKDEVGLYKQIQQEKKQHLRLKDHDFPDIFLTLKREQLPEELFIPHATHLSISPNTELEEVLKTNQGLLWTKVGKERLVGLKREEHVIPPLRHITVMGEVYRDYDNALKLRNIYDPVGRMFMEPVVTYKTKWQYCHELDKQADKWLYASLGCYGVGALFGVNSIIKMTHALGRLTE